MNRIERLREQLQVDNLDAMLVRNTSNIAYLTGFEGVFDEEQAHALLVTARGTTLHTDSRYLGACEAAAQKSASSVVVDGAALAHHRWVAARVSAGSLGIEDTVTLAEFRKLEEAGLRLVETHDVVLALRQIKDASELACLRAAQAITDAAFAHMVSWIKPGMTEFAVQRELDNFMFDNGAQGLAFPSIVATGPNGANPHAQPTEARLEAGQCVVMDFGARAAGYCSDMTRMIFLGEPSQRMRDAYTTLRAANEEVEALLKPGITGAQAHQHALDVLEAGGFGGLMGHGLGHGVGIDIHEEPVLALRNESPLQAGNVVTVEPGIYVPGEFGMRLEDCGVLTEDAFDVFTQTSHDMVII